MSTTSTFDDGVLAIRMGRGSAEGAGVMCEYCEQKDKYGYSKEIMSEVCIVNGEKLSVVIYGCELCGDINYCPMCGRNLREE
jgi:predicted aconitase with swiveling domain